MPQPCTLGACPSSAAATQGRQEHGGNGNGIGAMGSRRAEQAADPRADEKEAHLQPDSVFVFVVALTEVAGAQ